MDIFFVNFTGCEISKTFFEKILKKVMEKKLIPSESLTNKNKIPRLKGRGIPSGKFVSAKVPTLSERRFVPSSTKYQGEVFTFGENKISLEVVLLGEGRMRSVNKRYAGKNRITDVLSFPESEIKKPAKKDLVFIEPAEAEKNLGEILLCPSRIKKNAKKFKKDFKEEIAFDFIHGFLHLLGYGHKDSQNAKKMEAKEKEIMGVLRTANCGI